MALTQQEIEAYQRSIGYISRPNGGFMVDPEAQQPGQVLPLGQQYPQYQQYLQQQQLQTNGLAINGLAPGQDLPPSAEPVSFFSDILDIFAPDPAPTEVMPPHADIIPGELGVVVNGVPISGPGVPEPPKSMIAKEWRVHFQSFKYGGFWMWYWQLIDGRMMSYHSPTKTWKIWKPKKHIVISKDPRVSNLRKLGRLNKRVEKMLRPFQPKAKGYPAKALARTYLSAAEKKLLSRG